MTRFTVVIHDDNRDAWPHAPWHASIETPHGPTAVGMGATPPEAAAKALAGWRIAVALLERITDDDGEGQ